MGNVTVKESGEMVNIISPNVNNITSFKVHFSPKQEGTGDPSPENVREIVGWNGVECGKSRKNIGRVLGYSAKNVNNTSDTATYTTTNKYGTLINSTAFNDLDTPLVIEQTQAPNSTTLNSYQNGYVTVGIDNLIFEKKYNISFKVSNITNNLLNINLNNINLLVPSGAVTTVTKIIDNILVFKNVIFRQNTANPDRKSFEIRICGLSFTLSEFMVTAVDNDDFTYEPYQGTTTSIDWTDSAGTIYGGYIDLIKGELVATHRKVLLTSTLGAWNWWSNNLMYNMNYMGNSQGLRKAGTEILSDTFTPVGDQNPQKVTDTSEIRYYGTDERYPQYLFMANPEEKTKEDWRNWLVETYPNASIVYELATPIIYQLTPQQILTLKGINNIYSDTNGQTEIKFWTH